MIEHCEFKDDSIIVKCVQTLDGTLDTVDTLDVKW